VPPLAVGHLALPAAAIAKTVEDALAGYGVEVVRIPDHERLALELLKAASRDAAQLGRSGLTPQGDSMSEARPGCTSAGGA
jgi:hypothetical protein